MVQLTHQKRFNFLTIAVAILISPALKAADKGNLPLMQNIGIIPTQMTSDGSSSATAMKIKDIADLAYFNDVKMSGRFTVLDKDLVKVLWSSPIGRDELKKEHELHLFTSLSGEIKGDRIIFTSRLLDPDLKVWMQESVTSFLGPVLEDMKPQVEKMIRDVFYKKINRLPFDATITSVHGAYVTISAGRNLGVSNNDVFDINQTFVESRHPATGAWLTFGKYKVGSLKVIDSKEHTAIGMLMMQSKANAIGIGQGVVVKKSDSRKFYTEKSETQQPEPQVPNSDGVIVVEPLYPRGSKKPAPKKIVPTPVIAPNSPQMGHPEPAPKVEAAEPQGDKPIPDSPPEETSPSPEIDEEGSLLGDIGDTSMKAIGSVVDTTGQVLGAITEKFADNFIINVGQFGWWYNGPGATGTKVTWFLPVNKISGRLTREIMPNIKYGLGGGVAAGKTVGDIWHTSYEGNARVYWESPLAIPGSPIKTWQAGVDGSLSGIGITEGLYGGNDLVKGGAFGALTGNMPSGTAGVLVDWHLEGAIIPLTFGRVGYRGSYKNIRSSIGWNVNAHAHLRINPGELEYGAGFEWGGHNMLDSDGKETGISQFGLFGSVRYRY